MSELERLEDETNETTGFASEPEVVTEPAQTPYGSGELGSKYQGQQGPTPSRYWQNF